ncbi:MAG: hypothetical protein IJF82_09485 [Achromobacter sp.]|nr:hypothetical protein [Achromobacter sp.]
MILSLFIKGMAWIILEKSDEVKKPKVMLRIEETYRRKTGKKKPPAKAGGLRGNVLRRDAGSALPVPGIGAATGGR